MTGGKNFTHFFHFNKDRFEKTLADFISIAHKQALSKAAEGWLFSEHYDKEFSNNSSSQHPIKKPHANPVSKNKTASKPIALQSDDTDFLSEILKIPDIKERWEYVEKLINLDHKELRQDSFGDASQKEAKLKAAEFLSQKDLNIVIIGGGCVGLCTANFLKNKLGDFANILICENRASSARIKKPYARDWITNIHISSFEDLVDPKLVEIFKGLGSDNFIGSTIRSLETLMLLSCKNIGVSFYFDPEMELSFIEDSGANLIIDATGGKLEYLYPQTDNLLSELKIRHNEGYTDDFRYAGVHPYESAKHPISVDLKLHDGRYYPYLNDKRIHYPMFKMTKIPAAYLDQVMEFASDNNQDNIFYIWRGRLAQEVNEVLILINLQEAGFEHLEKHMSERASLKEFIEIANKGRDGVIDNRIKELANLLAGIDASCYSIKVEPPFRYEPNIKLLPQGITRVFSKPIIPIGDSYYPGHVKVGNGLGYHICYVTKLSEIVLSSVIPPLEELFQSAIAHHQAQDLEAARALYNLTLQAAPEHSDANHNLGVLELHSGRPQLSLAYFQKALNSNPQIEQYWISALEALIDLRMIDDARLLVQQARSYGINSDGFEKLASKLEAGKIIFN